MADRGDSGWEYVVISHSHWDREWYVPFQSYRIRLARLMDAVLEILTANPDYKHFMTDGQTAPVEDYLAIRPDRRKLVERLVREGRLLIGPWYVAPDEFLPHAESLIRNLQRGIRVARDLGGVMRVGYQPDAFGHSAHLPAILRGFGFESAVVWRGVDERARKTEFRWRSPDGSSVLALYLPLGYGFAWPLPPEPQQVAERLDFFRRSLAPPAATRYLAIMNGNDHAPPQPDLPALLDGANADLRGGRIVQSSLPQLLAEIAAEVEEKRLRLPVYDGEMRSSQRSPLLPGSISARMWVKQRSQRCEETLIAAAEPLSAWCALLRARLVDKWREPSLPWGPITGYPVAWPSVAGLLREAWRQLLMNQQHDPLYGAGADSIYGEVAHRFDACEQIAGDLARRMLTCLAAQVDAGGGQSVVVFNPLNGPRNDFVTFDWRLEDGEEVPQTVVDAKGRRHACQIVSGPDGEALPFSPPRSLKVGFLARDIPAYGYRCFRLELGSASGAAAVAGGNAIENEIFAVSADAVDGCITLRNKRSGRVYRGLNRFVDGGDCGDEYNHCSPQRDSIMDRPVAPPAIAVAERGPARWTLAVDMAYRLPDGLTKNRKSRARRSVVCRIRSLVRLYPGVARVEFETQIDNQARDHRLRVRFPTGVRSAVSHAEQHFGAVSRPIGVPEADESWVEQPAGTQPQKTFVDVNDGASGLLLANRGLPEYEALPSADGVTLALTLLRCVGWLSRPDLSPRTGPAGPTMETPDAQCPGRHVFEYAVVPHEGGWERAMPEAHRFARPLQAAVSSGRGVLPAPASLVEVKPVGLVVSAIKAAEDGSGMLVRVYNATDRAVRGRVRFVEPHGRVDVVNLNEEPMSDATVEDGWVRLRFRRNEVASLLFHAALGE
ncbi:MAG: glycoside hydrolase family 38 C-terminal domain-containing protein [Dehalococcoidia bacterium]|jgi:alpha-mannosidase